MNTRTLTRWQIAICIITLAVAIAGAGVIIYYIHSEVTTGIFNPTRFFFYFTIQTGAFFAVMQVVFFLLLKKRKGDSTKKSTELKHWPVILDIIRFSVTLYAVMIAPIYWGVVEPFGTWRLDNYWVVIHLAVPIAALLSWIVIPTTHKPNYKWVCVALLYPLVFVAFSIRRGVAGDGWYPYDFLNHNISGWGIVIQWIVILSIGVALIGAMLALLHRKTAKLGNNQLL